MDLYEKYLLCKTKLEEFYQFFNSIDKETNERIQNLFSYKELKNKQFVFNDNTRMLYYQLIDKVYECFKLQLQVIYSFLYKKEESDLEKIILSLPNNVMNVLNKYILDDVKIADLITIKDREGAVMYYIDHYCMHLQDILEMFFETKEYEESRKKFLNREEGKEERILLGEIKRINI